MQQITKEYKKRQRFTEDADPVKMHQSNFLSYNPFDSGIVQLKYEEDGLAGYLELSNLVIRFDEQLVNIPALGSFIKKEFTVLNTCGKTNTLAFSYGSPSYLCVSLCPSNVIYGHIYSGTGLIQLWELEYKAVYKYSLVHHGYTVLSMKFLPSTNNEGIGTLAACLANGDLCVYNLPIATSPVLHLQPIQVLRIPGLIFSCLVWIQSGSVAAGTQDGSIFYWKPGFEPYVKVFNGHKLPITGMTYHAEAVITSSLDGIVKVWSQTGDLIDSISLSKRWSYNICDNPLGKYLFYDNDATISPHKVLKFDSNQLESKKQLSQSNEGTVCSCFSPVSNFDYIVAAEGFIEAIYVSELEKDSKKRKTPWSRYRKILYQASENVVNVYTGENVPENINKGSSETIKRIDVLVKSDVSEVISWVGEICGVCEIRLEN
jgi:WD40 repeat protein